MRRTMKSILGTKVRLERILTVAMNTAQSYTIVISLMVSESERCEQTTRIAIRSKSTHIRRSSVKDGTDWAAPGYESKTACDGI